jgi:tetratricopeptide (TPR) repeat protein
VLTQLVLGEVYQCQRNFEQAEEVLNEGLKISKNHKMNHQIILVLYALEKVYMEQKKIKEANDALNDILKIHCEGEDKLKIALLKP